MAGRKKTGGNGKTRAVLLLLALIAVTAAFFTFVSRDQLPERIRNNSIVAKTYRFRDAMLSSPAPVTAADPEKQQLGYPKDDRKKLESLIGTEANTTKVETKNETEPK